MSILDDLTSESVLFNRWNVEAERYLGIAAQHPEAYKRYQRFKLELEPPHVVFDAERLQPEEQPGHHQLTERAQLKFSPWTLKAAEGMRLWLTLMEDTHLYLAIWHRLTDAVECEHFIILNKAGELEEIMETAGQEGVLFTETLLVFVPDG